MRRRRYRCGQQCSRFCPQWFVVGGYDFQDRMSVPVVWDKRTLRSQSYELSFGFSSAGAAMRENTQNDTEQLVLRGDAELFVSSLAIGEGRLRADARVDRDRFGTKPLENT